MNVIRRLEIGISAATLTVIIMCLHIMVDVEVAVVITIVAAWCMWGVARLHLPEYAQYALSLALLLPAASIAYLIQDGMMYVLLALPAVIRTAILVSFHHRIRHSVKLIIRDARGRPAR